jgi:hypothetical protein
MQALSKITSEGFALMFGSIHYLYTYPHFRLCSVLVGLLAGYYLYKFGSDELKEWPDWFKGPATKYAAITLVLIFYGFSMTPKVKYYIPSQQKLIFANMFTTFRMTWATCNAIILTRMASDWRKTYLMQLFASRFWQSLVKLNYAILLIHMEVLLYVTSGAGSVGYFSKQTVLADFSSAYFYCIPLATILHVVYENPIRKLVKQHVLPSIERLL